MKSVNELLKENRKGIFTPVKDTSSSLTADLDEDFIYELLIDELSATTKITMNSVE